MRQPGCCRGGEARGGLGVEESRRLPAPSGGGRWGPLALLTLLVSLVAQAVVEAAEQPAVVLGGEPARGIGLDVVDLAVVCGLVAMGMGADAVTQLYGSSGAAG